MGHACLGIDRFMVMFDFEGKLISQIQSPRGKEFQDDPIVIPCMEKESFKHLIYIPMCLLLIIIL